MKTNNSSTVLPAKTNSESWFESGYEDIERLIERLTSPYIDYGNVALHADELREECWWKVATLMSNGALERCKTRQQFFGFLKVSLRNHIRSHLGKHLFTAKRTGVEPSVMADVSRSLPRKAVHVRVDDPAVTVQLTATDSEHELEVLLRDFQRMLTQGEVEILDEILNSDEPASTHSDAIKRVQDRFLVFMDGNPSPGPGIGDSA